MSRNTEKSRELYNKALNTNDPTTMIQIGIEYENGTVLPLNFDSAMTWYLRAAKKGSAEGMQYIALLYENGKGVTKDYRKAIEWYLKAADKGNSDAMNSLGFMYNNGLGVDKNKKRAMEWYKKAANEGSVIAIDNIGADLLNSKDYVNASESFFGTPFPSKNNIPRLFIALTSPNLAAFSYQNTARLRSILTLIPV